VNNSANQAPASPAGAEHPAQKLLREQAERQERLAEIERSIALVHPDPGAVFEVRALGVPSGNGYTRTGSGYFVDRRKAAEFAMQMDQAGAAGIYLTLNDCNPALLARSPNKGRLIGKDTPTTSDHDITRRRWLFIDIDPERPAGIAASDEELQAARDLAIEIEDSLRARGWPYPLIAESGNGSYRLFRVDLPNDQDALRLIERFYRGLNELLGTFDPTRPHASIDVSVANAARIARVGGTRNRKGADTPERPHRMCIYREPIEECPVAVVPVELIQEVADLAPDPNSNGHASGVIGNGHSSNGDYPRLDVARWLADRGVAFKTKKLPNATAYLIRSPFDQNHGANGEVAIVQRSDGLLTYEDKHNSGQQHTWKDVKEAIGKPDPEHYDRPPRTAKTAASRSTTRPAASPMPVEVGTPVRARDRDNFGKVVQDCGASCLVQFVNPATGDQATVDLPKTQLVGLDGKPLVEPAETPRFITSLLTSEQLDDLDAEPKFLVQNAVPAGQVGAGGGKSKGCKTSVAGVDLSISVSSGTRFLDEFDVPEPAPVLFLCGESGASKIRRQSRHVCEARGLTLRNLPIYWGFDLPKLCQPLHVEALADLIKEKGIKLAIVDPLYLSLFTAETAGRSGDLFTMGATFEPLTAVARETGAAILLIHHFRKNRADDQAEPCSLEELSQAGLAEVARWWVLLDRREPYAGDGRHALWLRVGGSEGHASFWALDVDEGLTVDVEGNQRTTKWETRLGRVQDAKAEHKRQQENRRAEEMERREDERVDKLRTAMRAYPAGETAKQLRADTRMNNDTFLRTVAILKKRGEVDQFVFDDRKGKPDGYRLKS